MDVKYSEQDLISILAKDLQITVKIKDSFLKDISDLINCNEVQSVTFESEFRKFISEIASYPQEKIKKLKDKYKFTIEGTEFNFVFYFNSKDKKLTLTHFDKMEKDNTEPKIFDLILIIIELLTIIYLASIKKTSCLVGILPIVNIIFWLYIKDRDKKGKNTKVWINPNSIIDDLYKEALRSFNAPHPTASMTYHFYTWFNLWLFVYLLLSISDDLINNSSKIIQLFLMIAVLCIAIFITIYALKHLLKFFNLKYLGAFILYIILFLVGFLNKDYWVFVALVLVIINQILSKEIIYFASNISGEKLQKIENSINSNIAKKNEAQFKLKTNIAAALLYLFILFLNKSILIIPLLKFFQNDVEVNFVTETVLTGMERIALLTIIFGILQSKFMYGYRDKFKKSSEQLINLIVDKLYKDASRETPKVRSEISIFPNEKIEPTELIENMKNLPADIKVIWSKEPNWERSKKQCDAEIVVINADRTFTKHKVVLRRSK